MYFITFVVEQTDFFSFFQQTLFRDIEEVFGILADSLKESELFFNE
jgi:hypothetical protein